MSKQFSTRLPWKENFTSGPSNSAMNYVQFTADMVGSIALKQYFQDQKILPGNV